MPINDSVAGQLRGWRLIKKIGEGDAGEVFLVESITDHLVAILKRPNRSAFTTDILRQSSQINQEGRILHSIEGVELASHGVKIRTPKVLDLSKPGSEYSERTFIVIERAPGINLDTFTKVIQFGLNSLNIGDPHSQDDMEILQSLEYAKTLPDFLLLRMLNGLFDYLEHIHQLEDVDLKSSGLLWNDVKPGHIFWSARLSSFTVIDWGNGQIVGPDGASLDHRFSSASDYAQLLSEMGQFLNEVNPALHQKLAWPTDLKIAAINEQSLVFLRERIRNQLSEQLFLLQEIRNEEETLIFSIPPSIKIWERLIALHTKLLQIGELPNRVGFEQCATQLASNMITSGDKEGFLSFCQEMNQIPGLNNGKWRLLSNLGRLNPWPGLLESPIQRALLTALNEQWTETLWQLRLAENGEQQSWWAEVCDQVRQIQPEIGPDSITPLVALNRLVLTLQAEASRQPRLLEQDWLSINSESENEGVAVEVFARRLKETTIKRWTEYEPDPPNAGLDYTDVVAHFVDLNRMNPVGKDIFVKALEQPFAIVKIILESWERKEFETARRGLRKQFFWDPDRSRVFIADQAIARTPNWLETVRKGPEQGESLPEFVTRLELRGREIRNQVAPASWLDQLLEAFSKLRKGASPADILLDYTNLRSELPWLLEFHPPLLRPYAGPIILERNRSTQRPIWRLSKTQSGVLGPGEEIWLGKPLDTWAPEARGSSARVFLADFKDEYGNPQPAVLKLMRPGMADYALPLFREEAQILTLMGDVPGVDEPLEFGFLKLEAATPLPGDDAGAPGNEVRGSVYRLAAQEIQTFLRELEKRTLEGWLPYIALSREDQENNLMNQCDSGYTGGRFLSIKESIRFLIQILEILQIAHSRNIVYRDHKILHYYWIEGENGIHIIDWNVARRMPEGLSPGEKCADIVQFGARAMHHILTGRPAPGALPVGPTRPDEIEHAASTYTPKWTFDDQRLPTRLREIVERVLGGGYDQVISLRQELESLYRNLPDEA